MGTRRDMPSFNSGMTRASARAADAEEESMCCSCMPFEIRSTPIPAVLTFFGIAFVSHL